MAEIELKDPYEVLGKQIEEAVIKALYDNEVDEIKYIKELFRVGGIDFKWAFLVDEKNYFKIWSAVYNEVRSKFLKKCKSRQCRQRVDRKIEYYLYQYMPTASEDAFEFLKGNINEELKRSLRIIKFKYDFLLKEVIQ